MGGTHQLPKTIAFIKISIKDQASDDNAANMDKNQQQAEMSTDFVYRFQEFSPKPMFVFGLLVIICVSCADKLNLREVSC